MTDDLDTLLSPDQFPKVGVVVGGSGEYRMLPYGDFVGTLFKKESYELMLHHAKGGVCEEAGEISSAIKRHITYGASLDSLTKDGQTLHQNIVEELGDLFFYAQAIMGILGISLGEVLQHNADKLSTRYAGLVYANQSALDRADKPEGD
jgi:NTP pyrophosphatase (non-canonical NTP hydrolase)